MVYFLNMKDRRSKATKMDSMDAKTLIDISKEILELAGNDKAKALGFSEFIKQLILETKEYENKPDN